MFWSSGSKFKFNFIRLPLYFFSCLTFENIQVVNHEDNLHLHRLLPLRVFDIYFVPSNHTKMPSRTEKTYANSRVRRHSGEVILSKRRSKKEKETDTESVTTSSSAETLAAEPRCPLRFMLNGVLEAQSDEKSETRGCPLRRVQCKHSRGAFPSPVVFALEEGVVPSRPLNPCGLALVYIFLITIY